MKSKFIWEPDDFDKDDITEIDNKTVNKTDNKAYHKADNEANNKASSEADNKADKTDEAGKVAELTELLQRVQADFENYRKQVERRMGEMKEMAAQDFIRQLLPIIDNFGLALKNTELKKTEPKITEFQEKKEEGEWAEKQGEKQKEKQREKPEEEEEDKQKERQEELIRGLRLIHTQITSLLKDNGVKEMETEGKPFDPYFHEALMKVESEQPENTIIEEFQKGFTLHGRVLRHAKVKVSAGKKKEKRKGIDDNNGNNKK